MFGIDIGISVSSVSCVTGKGKPLDSIVLYGDRSDKDEWHRITTMADAIVDAIANIGKSHTNTITYVADMVSLEEPVFPYRTRNPRSYFVMCCLYALIRNKLVKRAYKLYSIHPLSAKATARTAFKGKKISSKFLSGRSLNKTGMIRAYKKLHGVEPAFSNKIGRETLADSYFIAKTGLDRLNLGMKK